MQKINGQQIILRPPCVEDTDEFISIMRHSQDFLHPWIYPPIAEKSFQRYLRSRTRDNQDGFLICHAQHSSIMGVINLNDIVRGAFQSAYLGYYMAAPYAGKGYMKEALALTIHYAFHDLQLHRLEANIQPGNHPSIALVKRCGFHKEGLSPRYLCINGIWRDHERWAILADASERMDLSL